MVMLRRAADYRDYRTADPMFASSPQSYLASCAL